MTRFVVVAAFLFCSVGASATPRVPYSKKTPCADCVAVQLLRDECVAKLPSAARRAFKNAARRRRYRVAARIRPQWDACLQANQNLDATRAVAALQADLIGLHASATGSVRDEAAMIAQALVDIIRKRSATINMVGSPLFNNTLAKLGKNQGAYCHEWTTALLTESSHLPWQHFTAVWGVANQGKFTENNAMIVTAAQSPLVSGLAVDIWRGAGKPYWLPVSQDHYKWTARFTK